MVCLAAATLVAMYGHLMVRRIDVASYNARAEAVAGELDVRLRFVLVVGAVTLVAAFASLFLVLTALSQILIWGGIAIMVGWLFFTVSKEA